MGSSIVFALGVGAPGWPATTGGWDPWLVVSVVLALVFVPKLLRRRRSPSVLAICLLTALLVASSVQLWGVPAAVAASLALVGILAGFAALQGRRPPSV